MGKPEAAVRSQADTEVVLLQLQPVGNLLERCGPDSRVEAAGNDAVDERDLPRNGDLLLVDEQVDLGLRVGLSQEVAARRPDEQPANPVVGQNEDLADVAEGLEYVDGLAAGGLRPEPP